MRLVFGLEQRFSRTPDGAVWSNGIGNYGYWRTYLQTFDEIILVARVNNTSVVPEKWARVAGIGVDVQPMPYYVGPTQYLRHFRSVYRDGEATLQPTDALIVRAPGQIAQALVNSRGSGPFGVEVIGDPWDAFSPGAIIHPLRPVFRRYFRRQLQMQCKRASAVAYVTRETLQKRYPIGKHAKAFQVTDGVNEVRDAFRLPDDPSEASLIFVGSLAQMYKAPDVLLRALAICHARYDTRYRLTVVGDGKHRFELEDLAASLGIRDYVGFLGELPAGDAVRQQLDQANLFVLPSRSEGLPRALIEAMARGLPCIGSQVGGFPELLEPSEMVEPGNPDALASSIFSLLNNPSRMEALSRRSLEVAHNYLNEFRLRERQEFHTTIREQTEHWIRSKVQE